MNNKYLNTLIEEKNEKNIFSLIATPKKNETILWDSILESFHAFLPHKAVDKKYFWSKDLTILYRFGFDIDFEDSFGNTLLFHLFLNNNPHKFLSFDTKDILKKTKKLYHNNHYNENILFYMARNLSSVSWKNTEDFISGQNLIDFIEKNPHFNLQQINKLNRNLINCCLLSNAFPEKLFDYLCDKKVSTTHIDKDGYNLLNFFPLQVFNVHTQKYLINLSETNDINHTNKFNENCISSFIHFISSKGHNNNENNNNENNNLKWLNFIFENILSETIFIKDKSILLTTLAITHEDYSFESKKIIPLQDKVVSFLKFKILDEKFPAKNITVKKPKI